MTEKHIQWHSQHIHRDFDMLTFGYAGMPLILFPTSKGSFYQYRDFGIIESIKWFIDTGRIKVYCPNSMDAESWYNTSIAPADRVRTHNAYENMIRFDVIGRALYETRFHKAIVAGCSFGGYHAINVAFRHPDIVSHAFSLGGALDIKQFLDGYYDDNVYFNNPPDYMSNIEEGWYLSQIKLQKITLGTGTDDICRHDNERLSGILTQKNIPHWLDLRQQVGHDWHWWREMLPSYLGLM